MPSNNLNEEIESLIESKMYEDALRIIEGVLAQGIESSRLISLKIDALIGLNKTNEALDECLKQARRQADESNFTQAIGLLRRGAEISPDNPVVEDLVNEFSRQTLGVKITPEVLMNCSLFDVLDAENFKYIARQARWKLYLPNQHIITQGEKADQRLFILLKGKAEVLYPNDQEELMLAEIKPGEIFGEVSFLTLRPRSAHVVSRSRVEVLEIPADIMNEVITKEPRVKEILEQLHQKHFHDALELVKKWRFEKKK